MTDIIMYCVGAAFIGAMLAYIFYFDNQIKKVEKKVSRKPKAAPYKLEPKSNWDRIPVKKSEDDFLDEVILAGAMMVDDDSSSSDDSGDN